MITMRRRVTALAATAFLLGPAFGQSSQTEERTRHFLDSYARGDTAAVMSVVDEGSVAYGSDAAEIFRGKAGISEMLRQDGLLWRGSASIGEMKDVSVVEQGDLATIFFNAPFRVGNREPVPVRFSMVWRREKGQWLLVQSQSAAVAEGQSAARCWRAASDRPARLTQRVVLEGPPLVFRRFERGRALWNVRFSCTSRLRYDRTVAIVVRQRWSSVKCSSHASFAGNLVTTEQQT
jgi:ketosteroid isomerase-like protein